MKAKDLIDAAAETLLDEGNVRWSRAFLLRALNQAQRAASGLKPDLATDIAEVGLAEGVRQKLAAPGLRLLDVVRNVGGDAITLVSRQTMTDLRAAWVRGRPARAIIHYCADENSPSEFLVYPPASDGQMVEIQRTRLPVDCANEDSDIGISDIYEMPLMDFMCYRAYMRDSESPGSQAKAMAHMQAFSSGLGGKAAADAKAKPTSTYPGKVLPDVQ